jgi:YVTN family beta-propeller protein
MMKIVTILILIFITSCEPNDPGPVIVKGGKSVFEGNGLFILNEGNFTQGNGSLSFYSSDSAKIYNNIFYSANGRSSGDIPYSILITGDTAYVVINNSGKIEMVERKTIKSLKTITGIDSPRYLVKISREKGYISSLYSNSLVIFSFITNTVTGSIDIGRNSEQILISGSKVYVASWSGERIITVLDSGTDQIITTIEVGLEPESMVSDRDGNIWIICSGGYMQEEEPTLVCLDPATDLIRSTFTFNQGSYPTNLRINSTGDSLFFLNRGVFRMSVYDNSLPAEPFISETGRLFYRMEPGVTNSNIFVTDANDYQRNGFLLIYSREGSFIETYGVGIIPGNMTFITSDMHQQ